jgi:hypothetical protein
MRVALLAAAVLAPAMAMAQADWIRVASTDDMLWEVKPGSFELRQTKGNVDIAVVVGRVKERKNTRITVEKWYVSLSDCGREMGKLVTLDVDGKFRYENDFVFGAGSVAAGIAEAISGAHAERVRAREKKGI